MNDMTDLETRVRERLTEDAALAPAPRSPAGVVRRTRSRQGAWLAGAAAFVTAVGLLGVAGLRSLSRPTTPAAPTVERSVNGVSMRIPEDWRLVDPADAGLEQPGAEQPGAEQPPRLIVVLAPGDPARFVGCPGVNGEGATGFVLTIQEEPLALAGPASRPWPVDLRPLDVGGSESACYPGWEFRRSGWTAGGRTFEARVGIGPDVADADRDALLAAYASMTFDADAPPATSAVIARGTAGGEDWTLTASRSDDGLSLGLEWSDGGMGSGGFGDVAAPIHPLHRLFGDQVVVFGAVSRAVARVEVFPADGYPAVSADVIDVPDRIGGDLDAFVVVADAQLPAIVNAYDEDGKTIAQESVGSGPT